MYVGERKTLLCYISIIYFSLVAIYKLPLFYYALALSIRRWSIPARLLDGQERQNNTIGALASPFDDRHLTT